MKKGFGSTLTRLILPYNIECFIMTILQYWMMMPVRIWYDMYQFSDILNMETTYQLLKRSIKSKAQLQNTIDSKLK